MALNSFNKALINVYTDYRGKENGGLKKWKGLCRNRTTATRGIFLGHTKLDHLRGLLLYAKIKH